MTLTVLDGDMILAFFDPIDIILCLDPYLANLR